MTRSARELRARLLAIVSASSLAAGYAACSSASSGASGAMSSSSSSASATSSSSGAGGASSSSSSSGDLDAGPDGSDASDAQDASDASDAPVAPPPGVACFDWSPDAGACPSDPSLVLFILDENGCVDGGPATSEPSGIISGPDAGVGDAGEAQCCFYVDYLSCAAGGRPYLEDGVPRVASLLKASSRAEDPAPPGPLSRTPLSPSPAGGRGAGARALAEAWARDALAEHASIASFSRFALALLAHGAPAELVADAHRAALDEAHHADLCFALASRYAGEIVAPSSFPATTDDGAVTLPETLADLAEATVREGCIGETIAALVATEQLAGAKDEAVRRALARIADDEARHAELAFRVVGWALREGGADVRARVARIFDGLQAQPSPPPFSRLREQGPGEDHGRLEPAEVARVAREAIEGVIKPCAAALLRATRAG